MAWLRLDSIRLTADWQMSSEIEDSNYVKLTHRFNKPKTWGWKGLFAVADYTLGLRSLFEPRMLYGDTDYAEIIYVPNIEIFTYRTIAVRSLTYWQGLVWDIDIDYWL